jgi:hypothetical protein
VSEPKFTQPARSNLLAPVLIAFLILGVGLTLLLRYTPHSTAKLAILKTSVYSAHTVFKSDSNLVNRDQSQDDLYVIMNVQVDDKLNLPIFIKDLTATLVTSDGQTIEASAVQKQEFENLYTAFPKIRSLSSPPLLREILIKPGKSAEGMVIVHFPVTEETWNSRTSAKLHIALYHQGPVSIVIPKGNAASSSNDKTTEEE